MPKLNVQQSNQNVIQAFKNALAIGNLKGIIASDGSHNFSTAGSNPNLLDNPWWGSGEVVNQRGLTSGQTTVSYSIDRWRITAGSAYGNWSLDENGLTITAASGTYAVFQQLLEPRLYRYLAGKTVTCSALLSDGTVVSGTVQSVDWSSNTTVVVSGNLRLWLVSGGIFRVLVQEGDTFTIRAVKLELGSVSTLANDAPPNYAQELAKCQRYFLRLKATGYNYIPIASGVWTSVSTVRMLINTPVPMRAVPTISRSGTLKCAGNGTILDVSALGALTITEQGVFANVLTNGSPVTWQYYTLLMLENAYIDLSADL